MKNTGADGININYCREENASTLAKQMVLVIIASVVCVLQVYITCKVF